MARAAGDKACKVVGSSPTALTIVSISYFLWNFIECFVLS